MTPAWQQLQRVLTDAPPVWSTDLADAPEPVRRYFSAGLGDPDLRGRGAVLEMRGRIKIGRWLPFRARQLLAPRFGTVWEAAVARIITGSDRYVAGAGGMSWKLFGLVPFVRAEGPDVSRSAAERAAGESIWVPSAVAPGTGTDWTAFSEDRIGAAVETDGHRVQVEHRIDETGTLIASSFQRWGDPDGSGEWALHPFGVEVAAHRRFGSVTIPSEGQAGWHHGTDRWADGVFFRFEITACTVIR